jgi:hypothetical protein
VNTVPDIFRLGHFRKPQALTLRWRQEKDRDVPKSTPEGTAGSHLEHYKEGMRPMTTETYDEKRHELEAGGTAFVSFAVSAGLIGLALMIIQIIL